MHFYAPDGYKVIDSQIKDKNNLFAKQWMEITFAELFIFCFVVSL